MYAARIQDCGLLCSTGYPKTSSNFTEELVCEVHIFVVEGSIVPLQLFFAGIL